jgi:hypothetical protein
MSTLAQPGVRRIVLATVAFAILFAGFAWALAEALSRKASPGRVAAVELARQLGPTDLVLVTEARYLRHLSLADRHSAFQDHPLAFEHFPSGALVAVPAHLQRRDTASGADANLVAPTSPPR